MLYPDDLAVGLREWDSVCQALLKGRQIVLLRKGAIYESGGEFELEFRRFLLFPTFLRQDKSMLKESAQDLFKLSGSEPKMIQIDGFADVTDIVRIETSEQLNAIEAHHIWQPKLAQMGLGHRPEIPLYLLLVKAHRLAAPVIIENQQKYAGCKGWVGLLKTINVSNSTPVLDSPAHQTRRDEIMMKIRSAPRPAEDQQG